MTETDIYNGQTDGLVTTNCGSPASSRHRRDLRGHVHAQTLAKHAGDPKGRLKVHALTHDHDPVQRKASNETRADALIAHRLHCLERYAVGLGERVDDTAAIQQQRGDALLG
jgi:hypothetical protein